MNSGLGGIRARIGAQWARVAGQPAGSRGIGFAVGAAWTDFLTKRTARERIILTVGMIAVVSAFYWLSIWQPLSAARLATVDRIAVLDRVIARAQTVNPATLSTSKNPDIPAATAITELASQFAITIRRIEPTGEQTSVTLEDVKYDTLIAWLEQLDQDYGLRPVTIDLDRRPEVGVVSAKLVLGN